MSSSRVGSMLALALALAASCFPRARATQTVPTEHARIDVVETSPAPIDVSADARDATVLGIRDVDWCNHGYGPPIPALVQCEASEMVSLEANGPPHSRRTYRFVSVTYGDLNGDSRDDALVLLESIEQPLLIERTPHIVPEPVLAAFDLRGGELYAYPIALPGPDSVIRIGIDGRAAVIVRRVHGRECTEQWTLTGESLQRRHGC